MSHVLQCVAVCCGVLRCVAVCCSVLQCVAVCFISRCVAVCAIYCGICGHEMEYHTFFDGYCSTVQGLLDWFEVDLGFIFFFSKKICGHEMEYHNNRYILHVSSRIEQWSRRNEPCSNKNKSCPRGFPAIGDNVLVPVSRRIESWSHRNESWSHRNEPCSNKNKSCPSGFPAKGDVLFVHVSRRIESWSRRNEPCSNKSWLRSFPQKEIFYLFMRHVQLSHGRIEMSHGLMTYLESIISHIFSHQ